MLPSDVESSATSSTNGHASTNGYDVPTTTSYDIPATTYDVPVTSYDVPVTSYDVPSVAAAYVPDVPVDSMAAPAYIPPANVLLTPIAAPVVEVTTTVNKEATPATPAKVEEAVPVGSYDEYVMQPNSPWPPPIFVERNIKPRERFYLDNRWYSQWNFFDKKANENKNTYYFYQRIIVVGSVTVPVLVSIGPSLASSFADISWFRTALDLGTVAISLMVAVSAALESLYTYGNNWTTYRRAAEEMQQEKHLYDVRAGRYANITDPFARFAERVEEIIAQQNGRFVQTIEKQQAESSEQNKEILDRYRDREKDNNVFTASYGGQNFNPAAPQNGTYNGNGSYNGNGAYASTPTPNISVDVATAPSGGVTVDVTAPAVADPGLSAG